MTDTTTSTEDINPTILSSDDLMDLRKPCDVPMPESVCKKFYIPDESDKNHVASLLKDQKRMLDEKVVSRIADLIQAEWKPDLKKAVTTKLKGKRQHVGIAVDGKVFLSPEETIFLLENGNLELLLNDVPLSTESAYAQILSDDLALEKYQVYSHLSRLGYIVVQHQKDADLVRNEKLHAMNKCQCAKRKRKHHEANTSSKKVCLPNGISPECRSVSPSQQLPSAEVTLEPPSVESSRLEQSEKTLNETSELEAEKHKETIYSVEGVSASNSDSIGQEQCTLTGVTTVNSSIKDNEGLKADVVSSTDDTERESTGVSPPENLKTQSVPKSTPHPEENTTELSKANHTSEATNSNAVEEVTTAVSSKSNATVSPNHSAVINEANTIHSDQTTQNNKETELSVTSEKNDDYSQDAVISVEEDVSLACSENGNSHIEPQSSNSMDSREITDSGDKTGMKNAIVVDDDGPDPDGSSRITTNGTKARVNVFRIDDDLLDESNSSDSDILCVDESDHDSESSYSCEETNDDSIQSLSETDDVMIVEVNKGRAEPLEVIDLSSDEENKNEPEKDATDDDDILFIEECPRSNSTTGRMQEWLPTGLGSKMKKEGGKKAFFKMERSSHDPDAFSFPNLFRKRVVCLPRPPAHLLPFNVHMNKEAYTIDLSMLTGPNIHRPVQRVWNSYKDLQQRMYNFKNEAGLACNYPKGFHSNSPQQNAHFGPYSSGPSLNHHSTPFQNNLLSQNNRLDSPNMDHGFSSHTVQSTAFHSNPMPGAMLPNHRFPMGPTQPSINPRGSPLLTGSPHLHNSHRRDFLNVTENSKQNTGCQPPNPWNTLEEPLDDRRSFPNSFQSSGHCEEASFTSSPNPWQNNRRNDEAIRSSTGVWMNPPMNTGFESSPNLRPNMPGNEESFRVGPNPWMNSRQNQGYGSSPNSCILSRGPPDFQHNTPFQDPYGSFSTPYMSNWRPLLLQNDAFYGNRQGFQPSPMDMRGRNFWDNPYPCDIPKSSARTSSWRDFKSSAHLDTDKDAEEGKDDDSEVQEVPIDIDEVLWSKEISPLVRPGTNMSLSEVVKALQITKLANVSTAACYNERLLPDVCSLKVSFDVYMPGTAYKKTCPTVPNHRIIVTRSTDPFPKLSDIVILQRRFKDNAFLQFAVVNNGSIAFFSFNNVELPVLLPCQ